MVKYAFFPLSAPHETQKAEHLLYEARVAKHSEHNALSDKGRHTKSTDTMLQNIVSTMRYLTEAVSIAPSCNNPSQSFQSIASKIEVGTVAALRA